MHRLREAALCAVIAVVGSLVAAASASASQPSTSQPGTSLVLVLRPTSESALQALVTTTHRLSSAERQRRLRALVPDAGRHRSIDDAVEALGLSVDRTNDWSVRVHGPAATVAGLFGTLAPKRADAAGRAYPLVPAALSSYVVAALPTSGRVAKPLARQAPRDGNDFRAAYSAPAGSTGAGLAVATVQLSGWSSAVRDMGTYAQSRGITFDVAKQYAVQKVDGADPFANDRDGGDEEVALDQEAILVTAPGATQVPYFAPNDDGGNGYIDAIRQVGTDAAKFHTAALSLSWGGCEASDDRPWVAAMDGALKITLAAGVTVFAATGDGGSKDCVDGFGNSLPQKAVDFPASSPYVVAVGGTTLPTSPPALGWRGSGGGESTLEALPSWQYPVAYRSANNRRLVPDIASDADPTNGLCVLDSDALEFRGSCKGNEFPLAGTSLASPTQAALLVDTLADAGWNAGGVGDIHPALYSGAAAGAVTDVTADDSGFGNGDYHSTTGYDLVTGLGTPVWTKLQSWLGQFDMRAPRGTRSTSFAISPTSPNAAVTYSAWSAPMLTAPSDCSAATPTTPPPTSVQLPPGSADGRYSFWVAGVSNTPTANSCHIATASVVLDRHAPTVALSVGVSGSGVATARWSYADAAPSAGLQKFVLVATAASATQWTYTTTSRSHAFNALPRGRWRLRVTAYDNAGNAAASAATLYDDTSAFSFGSRWKRVGSTAAYRRGYERASTAGAVVHTSVTGRTVVLYVTTCPTCGRAGVYDGHGRHLKTIDTYAAKTRYRVPVTVLSLANVGTRTLVVRVLPGKNSRSKGHDVGIDAMTVA